MEMENKIIYTFPNRYITQRSMYVPYDYHNRYMELGPDFLNARDALMARREFIQLNTQYMDRILNLLRSIPDPAPGEASPNDPLRYGFRFAIQQALGNLQQQPPSQDRVRDNVVRPFIDSVIDLLLPYVRMRWNETNGQPATQFIQSYFFRVQGVRTRMTSIPNM